MYPSSWKSTSSDGLKTSWWKSTIAWKGSSSSDAWKSSDTRWKSSGGDAWKSSSGNAEKSSSGDAWKSSWGRCLAEAQWVEVEFNKLWRCLKVEFWRCLAGLDVEFNKFWRCLEVQ